MNHFQTAKRMLNELTEESLSVNIVPSPRSTRDTVQTVAEIENLDNADQEWIDTEQHTVRIENDDGEYYAEVIIQVFKNNPIALIDWVEIVDTDHRGNNIGRTLHEEAVTYIDNETNAERTYTKIENTRMTGANIDTGFQQITTTKPGNWYRRDKQN